jgi:hemolysin-activating ACP:hemolysin acyltransferase
MPPEAYTALGQLIMLAGQTELYGQAPLLTLLETFIPALRAGCVSICVNENGEATGFIIHVFVNEDDHRKMVAEPTYLPPVERWSSSPKGLKRVWVIDAASVEFKGTHNAAKALKKSWPKGTHVYRRKYRGRYINPDLLETVIRHG